MNRALWMSCAALVLLCWGGRLMAAGAVGETLSATMLRCEYLVDPAGIGEVLPRLSWMLNSGRRGDRQGAYEILVASSRELLAKGQGDFWSSGRVDSDESAHVVYGGKALSSRVSCFWKVRVWSPLGDVGGVPAWSSDAMWTMGLLSPADWRAKWIDSSEAVRSGPATEPVKIIRAIYGLVSNEGGMDVAAKLIALGKNGEVNVVVNATNLGVGRGVDMGVEAPSPTPRQLVVEYEHNGKNESVTVAEGKTLTISNRPTRLWYLRKSFAAANPIRQATLYVTALGLYEISINGERVGDHMLAPDWTDYGKRIRYQAYDVTPMVKTGDNAMGAILANGWYAGHLGNGGYQQYGKVPALLAQLEITYADGSTSIVTTDKSWKTHVSPVLASDFMLGESYDARAEMSGWAAAGLDEREWVSSSEREEGAREMDSQVSPAVRETGLVKAIGVTEPARGCWTFDLGQNIVGVVRLKVSGAAGTRVTIRHAEVLNPDGTLYTANLRRATSTDTYICKGGGVEVWQPRFTFHGFRYVEVTGLLEKPAVDAVTGVVWGTDSPRTGSFSCSDARVNQLVSNIEWGQRGNYLSVPTDCPQRDERLGWMGDAQVFVRTATDNADIASFFTKWLVDVDDAQRRDGAFTDVAPWRAAKEGTPAWGDAGVICPWTIYLAYGDKRILEQHLPAMTKWVEWCRLHSTDLIRDKDRGGDYGDWLAIGAVTPKDVIGTAYFAYSAHLVSQAYKAVGNAEQAAKYEQLFEEIKAAFNKKYVLADGRITGDTQSCYAMALKFELLPENLRGRAADYLEADVKAKDWHLSTGFVGVSYLLPTLTQAGKMDTAYKLLLQETFPSWLFSVKQGATTMWERWDGWTPEKGFQTPSMNSFNHYSLGSCGEWLYDTVAGISWDPEKPGYKHILLRPQTGEGLTSATGSIRSPYGTISSGWKIDGGGVTFNVVIPPNSTATLTLPAKAGAVIMESGKAVDQAEGVKFQRAENDAQIFDVQSGAYSFSVRP